MSLCPQWGSWLFEMRTGFLSIVAFLLLQLAASQQHRHGHQHDNRDVMVVTDITYATVEAVDVVVYVSVHGEPWTTKTIQHSDGKPTQIRVLSLPSAGEAPPDRVANFKESHFGPPSPPLASQLPPPPEKPACPIEPLQSNVTQEPPAVPKTPIPPVEVAEVKLPPPAPPAIPSSSSGPEFSSGISYSPYNADSTCKSASQIANDFKLVTQFSVIRLYGTDCNQIANVLTAINGKEISLFLGISDLAHIPSECKTIVDAIDGYWSLINTVSVGNELIGSGKASVEEVTAAIEQVRSTLRAAGYNGPVVTVDTMVAMKANPKLCHASDFCAINCHAFFDGNIPAEGAGHFVLNWAQQVSEATGGKTVVITETGWPTQGDTNNKAVPSKENHNKAIASIRQNFSHNLILFSAFNDLWKKDNENTHNAEKFWGILGNAPS